MKNLVILMILLSSCGRTEVNPSNSVIVVATDGYVVIPTTYTCKEDLSKDFIESKELCLTNYKCKNKVFTFYMTYFCLDGGTFCFIRRSHNQIKWKSWVLFVNSRFCELSKDLRFKPLMNFWLLGKNEVLILEKK